MFDLPEIDGRTYLAMEYVRGRNLHQVIQRRGARGSGVPPLIALTAVAQSLRGLHYAHCLRSDKGEHLGVVHRDVSPGNILMSFLGEIKVTDFGIAKLADSPKYTGPRSIRGKARYVAPEQVHGRPATITSDIYSAGVVLAEALMGAPLWERGTIPDTLMAIVTQDRAEIIDRILRDIPSMLGLRRILRNTLSTAPDQRPQSALHFAEILEAIVRAHGAPPTPVDLGEFLRNLFRGDDDVPRHDGFGRTGLPTPELKRDRLDEEDTVTNVDDTRPPPLPFDAPAFEPPPSVPVVPPMVPADATPTPLTTTTGFRTAGIPAGAAVFEDPADPAQQFSPPPSAPPPRSKTDTGSTVFTLMGRHRHRSPPGHRRLPPGADPRDRGVIRSDVRPGASPYSPQPGSPRAGSEPKICRPSL